MYSYQHTGDVLKKKKETYPNQANPPNKPSPVGEGAAQRRVRARIIEKIFNTFQCLSVSIPCRSDL